MHPYLGMPTYMGGRVDTRRSCHRLPPHCRHLRQTSEMALIIQPSPLWLSRPLDEHRVTGYVACICFPFSASISAVEMTNISRSRARHHIAERSGTGINLVSICNRRTTSPTIAYPYATASSETDICPAASLPSRQNVRGSLNFRHGRALWAEICISI